MSACHNHQLIVQILVSLSATLCAFVSVCVCPRVQDSKRAFAHYPVFYKALGQVICPGEAPAMIGRVAEMKG